MRDWYPPPLPPSSISAKFEILTCENFSFYGKYFQISIGNSMVNDNSNSANISYTARGILVNFITYTNLKLFEFVVNRSVFFSFVFFICFVFVFCCCCCCYCCLLYLRVRRKVSEIR